MVRIRYPFIITVLLAVSSFASAHIQMAIPYPINSQHDPETPDHLKDYSYTNPLEASGLNYPCKAYQNQRSIRTTATYTAGQQYELALMGSATHDGGSCQISLSFDDGKTFRVIKSIIGGCPLQHNYTFTIPSFVPSGDALLAWSWVNLIGNREYYMNCAQVEIKPSSAAKYLKKHNVRARRMSTLSQFEELPYIWRANLDGLNTCATIEGVDVVYPHPGQDVEYGDGLGSSSAVTGGRCDDSSPPGQAYEKSPSDNGDESTSVFTSSPLYMARSMSYTPYSSYLSTRASLNGSSPMKSCTSATVYSTVTSTVFITASPGVDTSPAITTQTIHTTDGIASTSTPNAQYTSSSSSNTAQSSSSSAHGKEGRYTPNCGSAAMGSYKYLRDGQGFAVCNWGRWVDMGSVAAGTECTGPDGNAQIVAISTYR